MKRRFDTVLVANRGEIAVRILRSASEMGYRTVSVYSEADADAPHTRMADHAVCIGPSEVSRSYLDIDAVLLAARESGAQAIHPGYGFLSENPLFPRACAEAGLVFIGPDAETVELMGNKAAARRRIQARGIPCVPGFDERNADDAQLVSAAETVGYPLMVKAAAGGGGRGMYLVQQGEELPDALRAARSTAMASFGSDELILERAVLRPRHIEVQVFADELGNVIHLGERDCSVQRRHQKVVEEAPGPAMTEELRAAICECAVQITRDINYRGAGTVEFLLDDERHFYFLEMNTRLQVEHPVTEMITGLDLVALQLHVAQGLPLNLSQADIALNGHAIEVRLYAEDPSRNFLPRTGVLEAWVASSKVRVDSGVDTGSEVTPFYDSMLAKFIAYGNTREVALQKLIAGLKESLVVGLVTNRDFLLSILESQQFCDGKEITTDFLEECFGEEGYQLPKVSSRELAAGALLFYRFSRDAAVQRSVAVETEMLDWSTSGYLASRFRFDDVDVLVRALGDGRYSIAVGDSDHAMDVLALSDGHAELRCGGERLAFVYYQGADGVLSLSIGGRMVRLVDQLAQPPVAEESSGAGLIRAPMPGLVQEVFVSSGDLVVRGQRLLVLEAMKMQHDVLADKDGEATEIRVRAGEQVAANDCLMDIV